jgi:hypothetical protein
MMQALSPLLWPLQLLTNVKVEASQLGFVFKVA